MSSIDPSIFVAPRQKIIMWRKLIWVYSVFRHMTASQVTAVMSRRMYISQNTATILLMDLWLFSVKYT